MGFGLLNNQHALWTADELNYWDVRDGLPVLVVAGIDEETGKPFTQETALELLDEVDLEQLEEWSHEQGRELGEPFERVPVSLSLGSFQMAKAA